MAISLVESGHYCFLHMQVGWERDFAEDFFIRPHIVQLLPIVRGIECENPYIHIKDLE